MFFPSPSTQMSESMTYLKLGNPFHLLQFIISYLSRYWINHILSYWKLCSVKRLYLKVVLTNA